MGGGALVASPRGQDGAVEVRIVGCDEVINVWSK
jgi:hypothetical protein